MNFTRVSLLCLLCPSGALPPNLSDLAALESYNVASNRITTAPPMPKSSALRSVLWGHNRLVRFWVFSATAFLLSALVFGAMVILDGSRRTSRRDRCGFDKTIFSSTIEMDNAKCYAFTLCVIFQ